MQQKGRLAGRPKSLNKEKADKLRRLRASGEFSVSQICEMVGISRSVYYRENNKMTENQ